MAAHDKTADAEMVEFSVEQCSKPLLVDDYSGYTTQYMGDRNIGDFEYCSVGHGILFLTVHSTLC